MKKIWVGLFIFTFGYSIPNCLPQSFSQTERKSICAEKISNFYQRFYEHLKSEDDYFNSMSKLSPAAHLDKIISSDIAFARPDNQKITRLLDFTDLQNSLELTNLQASQFPMDNFSRVSLKTLAGAEKLCVGHLTVSLNLVSSSKRKKWNVIFTPEPELQSLILEIAAYRKECERMQLDCREMLPLQEEAKDLLRAFVSHNLRG